MMYPESSLTTREHDAGRAAPGSHQLRPACVLSARNTRAKEPRYPLLREPAGLGIRVSASDYDCSCTRHWTQHLCTPAELRQACRFSMRAGSVLNLRIVGQDKASAPHRMAKQISLPMPRSDRCALCDVAEQISSNRITKDGTRGRDHRMNNMLTKYTTITISTYCSTSSLCFLIFDQLPRICPPIWLKLHHLE